MRTDERPSMAELERYERELTERQRFVLGLIARGRTNPEIAAQLGITLDGAKWHVREILTKLGLSSREDAASYWRERRRWPVRARNAVRGLAAPGLWKLAFAGAAATATVVGVVVLVALIRGGTIRWGASNELEVAFYMEGTSVQRREGTQFALGPATTTDVRWWYQDNQHFRQQFVNSSVTGFDREQVVVADGDTVTYPVDGQYYRYSLACDEVDPHRLYSGESLGLLPDASVDDLVQRLNHLGGAFATHAQVAGEDKVLGYQTTVVEFGPTWVNGAKQTQGGVGRIWIDPIHMVALRSTTEGNDGSEASRAEVTKLVFDGTASASVFDATLPEGQQAAAHECAPR